MNVNKIDLQNVKPKVKKRVLKSAFCKMSVLHNNLKT